MDFLPIFSSISLLCLVLWQGSGEPVEDKEALLDFVNKFPPSRPLNWNESSPMCASWTGVTCNEDKSRVIAIRLPGVGFHGTIPPDTISRLSALQTLSLRSNVISGHFPSDFSNLKNLSFLYLQFNNLSGPLPDFSAWKNLTVVNLSNNHFNGSIPVSLNILPLLSGLNLANNSLSGEIPDLNLSRLQVLNLSNNNLQGTVPKSLLRFPHSAFSGNNISFRTFSTVSPAPQPAFEPSLKSRRRRRLSEAALLGVVVAAGVLGLVAFISLTFVCCSRRGDEDEETFSGKLHKGEMSPEKAISRNQDANNKLVFFQGCNYAFDLEDLLRASAEVLGKGTFGTAYKAILEDATTVVVKRLKEVAVGKKDFEQHMEIVGSLKHENVVELKAYYYSKDEKLMVYDYHSQGSIASILHAKRGEERVPLDWDTRLKIALGAARGIARIHVENGGKLVHGNIKSSNIFLNTKQYGSVSDLGLATISSSLALPISRAAGYRAPEQTPPVSLSLCNFNHVLEFLRYLDQFGKTKVHLHGCIFFGQPDPPAPCTCPLRQAWGSLDALIGRLRAAYEEHGGSPETNPFGSGAIRVYLREVKECQAKARGIPYTKKKKKKNQLKGPHHPPKSLKQLAT